MKSAMKTCAAMLVVMGATACDNTQFNVSDLKEGQPSSLADRGSVPPSAEAFADGEESNPPTPTLDATEHQSFAWMDPIAAHKLAKFEKADDRW